MCLEPAPPPTSQRGCVPAHGGGADDVEKRAAEIWLIDKDLVEGQVIAHGRINTPCIGRINGSGIDVVESVLDSTFTEI